MFLCFSCFRYTTAQRADAQARASQTQSPGLPPYHLVLSRIVNPFSSPVATTPAGLEIRSADLHGAHRGSRPPTPVIASGRFLYHTTGAPPNDIPLFTHEEHQHHFILEWRYGSEGRLYSRVLVCSCIVSLPLLMDRFPFLGLAQQVSDAYLNGTELHLKGSWPMQAMTWTATNLEARGRLFEVPLSVPVELSLADEVSASSASAYPRVTTHNTTCRSSGGYRPDAGTFGKFLVFTCLLFFSIISLFLLCI